MPSVKHGSGGGTGALSLSRVGKQKPMLLFRFFSAARCDRELRNGSRDGDAAGNDGLGEVGGRWYRTDREGDGMATSTQICATVSNCSSGGGEDGSGRAHGGDGGSSTLGEHTSSERGVLKLSPLHAPFESGGV